MSDDGLFDLDMPQGAPEASAERRRTLRQAGALTSGAHPLSLAPGIPYLPLHPEAAPADDRTAPGRRCRNFRFRESVSWNAGHYPKCVFGTTNETGAPRASHGAATDVRGWWPACKDHEPGDPAIPDGMRWMPDGRDMR